VPLSISSSNDRLPAGNWTRTWVLAVTLALAALLGYEWAWRLRGFEPSVSDDGDLWSYTRGQLQPDDPQQVVLIGSSRIRFAIDSDTWAQSFHGRKPLQLAINGASCLPVLQELSADQSFRGRVLVDTTLRVWFREGDPLGGTQAEYVRKFQERPAAASIEEALRILVQSHLVLRLPAVAPIRLLGRCSTALDVPGWLQARSPRHDWLDRLKAAFPKSDQVRTLEDRSIQAAFGKLDVPEAVQEQGIEERILRTKFSVTPAGFRSYVAQIADMVRAIKARGGDVVFLMLPVSGRVEAMEEELYPRHSYWNVLAAQSQARAIHFRDYDRLSHFSCPDGSHLDAHDAKIYTSELAGIVSKQESRAGNQGSGRQAGGR
jgi:hypothetical protein